MILFDNTERIFTDVLMFKDEDEGVVIIIFYHDNNIQRLLCSVTGYKNLKIVMHDVLQLCRQTLYTYERA